MNSTPFDSLLALAQAEFAAGALENAIRYCEQAREIAQQLGNQLMEAVALHRIGAAESERGNLERAASLLSAAAEIYKSKSCEDALAAVLIDQGIVAKDAGEYDLAEKIYQKALELGQRKAMRSIVLAAKGNLAQLARRRGDSATAIALLQDVIPEFERLEQWDTLLPLLDTLAATAIETKRYDVALSASKKLQTLATNTNQLDLHAATTANMGHVYNLLHQFEDSKRAYEEALDCFRRLGDVKGMSHCYVGLASAAQIIGTDAEMILYLRLAKDPTADSME